MRLEYARGRDTGRACAIWLSPGRARNTGLVQIDHDAAEFPFVQLAAILRARIEDGTYQPGRRIPPMTELEAESGLSPMTVRRAIKLLIDEGLVKTVPGRGTFVR